MTMQVPSTKLLAHSDQNFNWAVVIYIASALGAIIRISHLVPFNVLIDEYNSLDPPYFDYRSAVWGNVPIMVLTFLKNFKSSKLDAQPLFY